MKKLIIFDAMGVIFKTCDDVKDLLYPYLKKLNSKISYEKVKVLYLQLSLGKIKSADFFRLLGFSDIYPQIEKDYLDTCLELDFGFTQTADALKDKYNLALLSNDASRWSRHLRERHDLNKYFSDIVISAEVGIRKPSPDIFKVALIKTGTQAQDSVLIDDSPANIAAASKSGLNTIWFNRRNKRTRHAWPSAKSFDELPEIIEEIFE